MIMNLKNIVKMFILLSELQIQCSLYQDSKGIFHTNRANHPKTSTKL